MNLFRWLVCQHEYGLTFFESPTRAIVNLTCAHCGQELIFPLSPNWNAPSSATPPATTGE